jgi:hypothetical protein
MELGSYFLFLQEKIKDIIIKCHWRGVIKETITNWTLRLHGVCAYGERAGI